MKTINRNIDDVINYNVKNSKQQLLDRNRELYAFLLTQKVCVVPDPRLNSLDSLPHFEFLDSVKVNNEEAKIREKRVRWENR